MKRILIIDDDQLIATIYRNKFARRGFVAEVAADGKDGLAKVEQWKPDVLLMDLAMPNIDGLGLLRTLKSNPQTDQLPVVVYSNSFSKTNEEEVRKLGASRLLSKSETRPDQLLDLVSELVGEAQEKKPAPDEEPGEVSSRNACARNARSIAAEMRPLLNEFFGQNQASIVVTLQHKAYSFTSNAWTAGLQRAAIIGEALEALLRRLSDRPDYLNLSTYKTVLQGVECLEDLLEAQDSAGTPLRTPQVFIVDDQELSILAASRAIEKAKMHAYATTEPMEALKLLEAHPFDLVILDIDMPGMDGNSLCHRLRRFPWHEHTPVIFFSKLTEIEDRLRAATVGGSDFIAKPFLTVELAVKALVWVWKKRTHGPRGGLV